MANAAVAYENNGSRAWRSQTAEQRYSGSYRSALARARPSERQEDEQRPDLHVVEGRRAAEATQPQLNSLLKAALTLLAVAVVMAAFTGIARVALINHTVKAAIAVGELDKAIADARATGLSLEKDHALTSSSIAIQNQASALGMVPVTVDTLTAAASLSPEARAAIEAVRAQQQAEAAAAAETLAAQQRAAAAAQAAAQRAAANAAAASPSGGDDA
jgi:hypothetical protein